MWDAAGLFTYFVGALLRFASTFGDEDLIYLPSLQRKRGEDFLCNFSKEFFCSFHTNSVEHFPRLLPQNGWRGLFSLRSSETKGGASGGLSSIPSRETFLQISSGG